MKIFCLPLNKKGLIVFAIPCFLINHFIQFSTSYKLETPVLIIWEQIFDYRSWQSPLLLIEMLSWSVAYFLRNYNCDQTLHPFIECTLLNHRMPKCNTMLQSENGLFEPEIHQFSD